MNVCYLFTSSGGILVPKVPLRPVEGIFRGHRVIFEAPVRISPPDYAPNPTFNPDNLRKIGLEIDYSGPSQVYLFVCDGGQIKLSPAKKIPHDALNDLPCDCFRITLRNHRDTPDARAIAIEFFDTVLAWIRILTHQYWAGRSVEDYGDVAGAIEFEDDGTLVGVSFKGLKHLMTEKNQELATQDIIIVSVEKTCDNSPLPFDSALELDVYHFGATRDLSLSVLFLSSYIETLRDAILENGNFELKDLRVSKTDILKHLSTGFQNVFGRNLAKEDPDCFSFLTSLWICRGHVAHGQPFRWIEEGLPVLVDSDFKEKFMKKGFCIIRWLKTI